MFKRVALFIILGVVVSIAAGEEKVVVAGVGDPDEALVGGGRALVQGNGQSR